MKKTGSLLLILIFLSSCTNSSFTSRRFPKHFYTEKINTTAESTSFPVSSLDLPISPLQSKITNCDPERSRRATNLLPKINHLTIQPLPADTIPPEDEDVRVKLTKKEKVSFGFVLSGTILMMLGLVLAVYVLIIILQGATAAASIWYFIGALVLIGFLLREWGMLMKT